MAILFIHTQSYGSVCVLVQGQESICASLRPIPLLGSERKHMGRTMVAFTENRYTQLAKEWTLRKTK